MEAKHKLRILQFERFYIFRSIPLIIAPLGAFSQSGHALQWGLILGGNVVLTEGVRRAGWAAGQHVRGLRFSIVSGSEPI